MQNPMAHVEATGCELPHTRRGMERRLALLLSANTLFLEHGYDAVSLDDIVQHAGGSKASIYKYFGNKDGLFTAICDYRREQFFKDICIAYHPDKISLREYLVLTLCNFHKHIILPENAAFMRLVVEQTQVNSKLALYLHEQGPQTIQLAIAQALAHAHADGSLNCKQPLYSAQLYFGILRNLEWRILMNLPIEENEQNTEHYIAYCVDRFLDGHQKL